MFGLHCYDWKRDSRRLGSADDGNDNGRRVAVAIDADEMPLGNPKLLETITTCDEILPIRGRPVDEAAEQLCARFSGGKPPHLFILLVTDQEQGRN